MSTAVEPQRITEINKSVLLDSKFYCTELHQNPKQGKPIKLNLEFSNYQDLGFAIECLLNSVSSADEDSLKREPIMFQQVTLLATELLNKLPFEFLDKLLVKEDYYKDKFTNIENL